MMVAIEPDILSATFSQDPNAVLEVMRDDHPVTFSDGMQSWLISRYDDVERAF